MNSSPPEDRAAIPRGKIDPFPGFPTGSGGSYITDGHLYISNPALRPGSSELPVALAFDLLGIQKHFLPTNVPELRNSGAASLLFYRGHEIPVRPFARIASVPSASIAQYTTKLPIRSGNATFLQ